MMSKLKKLQKTTTFILAVLLAVFPLSATKANDAKSSEKSSEKIDKYINNPLDDQEINIDSSTQKELDVLTGEWAKGKGWKKPPLKISGIDLEAIMAGDVDMRVLKYLLYLTTSKENGGAGFHHIKVSRIVKNYRGKRNESKETDYEEIAAKEGKKEVEPPNESAHAEERAQAVDISEIDTFRCSIKTPTGSKKTPPKPIQVAWQDKAPGSSIGDPFGGFTGGNFFNLAESFFASGFLSGVSEDLEIMPEDFSLNANSLPGIILGLGRASFAEDNGIEMPSEGDFQSTLVALGKKILAQQTGFSPLSFEGKNSDEWDENITKGSLETQLKLLPGSLKGEDTDDWSISAGKRATEESLTLRPHILDAYGDGGGVHDLAQAMVETILELPSNSFKGSTKNVESKAGSPLKKIIPSPARIDEQLSLKSGTTKGLLDGKVSIKKYLDLVQGSIIKTYIDRYKNPYYTPRTYPSQQSASGQNNGAQIFNGYSNGYGDSGYTNQGKNTTDSGVDQAWNAPNGAVEQLQRGNSKTFYRMYGVSKISSALGLPREEIDKNVQKAKNGTVTGIDVSRATQAQKYTSGDWIKIFQGTQKERTQTLKKLGSSIFYNEILPQAHSNLYLDFRRKDLQKLYESKGSVSDFVKTLGAKALENIYDLPQNTIVKNQNDDNKKLAGSLKKSQLKDISHQINLNTGLEISYGNASDYKVGSEDVISLLQGRIAPLAIKLGGREFDNAVRGLPGNSQDYLKGKMSAQRLMANAGLLDMGVMTGEITRKDEDIKKPGLNPDGSDPRVGKIVKVIDENNDVFTKDKILNWYDVDSDAYKGYSFMASKIAKHLKDPLKNSRELFNDLNMIKTETIAAKGGLLSGSLNSVVLLPQLASDIIVKEGSRFLSRIMDLKDSNYMKLYKIYTERGDFSADDLKKTAEKIGGKLGIIDEFGDKEEKEKDTNDAENFVTGDTTSALEAWSIAMFKDDLNDGLGENTGTLVSPVKYRTIADSWFGDFKLIDDAVKAVVDVGEVALDNALYMAKIKANTAVRNTMNKLKEDANFKIMDAMLAKHDPAVPDGFSEAMFKGTDEERFDMLVKYAKASGMGDEKLSEIVGYTIPEGTFDSIVNGEFDFNDFSDKFINANFSENMLFNFGDNVFGFQDGTVSTLYDSYKQYQNLQAAYESGQISAQDYQTAEIALAVTAADKITGGAISEMTSPIDDALGLPSGTTMQLAIALATGNYVQAAIIFAGAIFGWGKMKCPDLKKLSQKKVRALLDATYTYALQEKQSNSKLPVIPSQVLTWRDEDIQYLLPLTEKIYGPGGKSGRSGVFESLNPREIHIGF